MVERNLFKIDRINFCGGEKKSELEYRGEVIMMGRLV